jgi:hypothetical protein
LLFGLQRIATPRLSPEPDRLQAVLPARTTESAMDHPTTSPHGGPESAMDYEEHERTYHGFLRFTKYVTIAVPFLLAFVFYWTR